MIKDKSLIEPILRMYQTGFSLYDLVDMTLRSHYLSKDFKDELISDLKQIHIMHCHQEYKKKKKAPVKEPDQIISGD